MDRTSVTGVDRGGRGDIERRGVYSSKRGTRPAPGGRGSPAWAGGAFSSLGTKPSTGGSRSRRRTGERADGRTSHCRAQRGRGRVFLGIVASTKAGSPLPLSARRRRGVPRPCVAVSAERSARTVAGDRSRGLCLERRRLARRPFEGQVLYESTSARSQKKEPGRRQSGSSRDWWTWESPASK